MSDVRFSPSAQLANLLDDSMSLEEVQKAVGKFVDFSPKQISSFLSQLSKLGRPLAAWNAVRSFEKLRVSLNQIHQNILLASLGRSHHWSLALHLLGPGSDAVAVSSVMEAVATCRWQLAVELFNSAQRKKITPDVVMVSSLIKACDAGRNWHGAVHLLELMPVWQLRSNQITYTNILSACSSCGQWPSALSLLSGMPRATVPPNVHSATAALCAYEMSGQWRGAMELLRRLGDFDVYPNTATYNAVIKVCSVAVQWQVAIGLYDEMCTAKQDHVWPNALTLTSLLSCIGNSQEWQQACALVAAQSKGHLHPITWNSFVNALSLGWQWESALDALFAPRGPRGPRGFGALMDSTGFHSVIRAADAVSHWQLAIGLLGEMQSNRVPPCLLCCSSAMRACRKEWKVALELLDSLPFSRLAADAQSCTALLTACGQAVAWEVALDLATEIPECMNSISCSALCSTFSAAGMWHLTFQLLDEMLDSKLHSFSESKYDHLVQAGSSLDVFKHSVLVLFLQDFCADPEPFVFIDSHAGRGLYALDGGRKNFQRGIQLLQQCTVDPLPSRPSSPLAQYLRAAARTGPGHYPGSAALAASWLRPQDRAMLFEISRAMSTELAQNIAGLQSGASVQDARCPPLRHRSRPPGHEKENKDL
ncbi:unnamed protein product [Cladocopium goreaui]|uniref:RNA helicase n=1 Tax=Cladocopium goreaui TaxID=2562237 RepID=A0A9P1FGW5_9DINO|nr:unnamed protein product [Cladocopium goreaui]